MDTLLAPLAPGRILARKYEVVGRIGHLWKLSERATGIERTARAFGGDSERLVSRYAQRLHKLRHCEALMQYRTQETVSLELGIFTQAVYGEGNVQKAKPMIRTRLGGRYRDAGDLVSALDHLDWTR